MNKKYGFVVLLMGFIILSSCDKNRSINTTGTGGSMARFTIAFDHLYIVDEANLKVYSISQSNNPVFITEIEIGTNIETIFPYSHFLFIGSENGMYVYDIESPGNPEYVSSVVHMVGCDPVVANDTLAFVTLRSGGECRANSTVNRLEIIDISNINQTSLIRTIDMDTPYGLGLDDTLLFICHGDFGLGVYSIANIDTLKTLKRINNIKAYDVIPNENVLMLIGEGGFYQFSYHNPDSIYLISYLPFYDSNDNDND